MLLLFTLFDKNMTLIKTLHKANAEDQVIKDTKHLQCAKRICMLFAKKEKKKKNVQ